MKTKILIVLPIIYTLIFSCRESAPDDSNPVTPKDSCIVYEYIHDSNSIINVYNKYDSTPGFGYSTKVNMKTYFTAFIIYNSNSFQTHFISRDRDSFLTDYLLFYDIKPQVGCYTLKISKIIRENIGQPTGEFSSNDEDVVIDNYLLDTSRSDN